MKGGTPISPRNFDMAQKQQRTALHGNFQGTVLIVTARSYKIVLIIFKLFNRILQKKTARNGIHKQKLRQQHRRPLVVPNILMEVVTTNKEVWPLTAKERKSGHT